MKRTVFQWLAISSIIVLTVTAGTARTRPRYGGTLRAELRSGIFDEAGPTRPLIVETLTALDERGRVQPFLATRWESQNDGRRWQFWVRENVQFHDNARLTAETVAQALAASCKPCEWSAISTAGNAVVLEFNSPKPAFAAEVSLPRYAIIRRGEDGTIFGTGPYRIENAGSLSTTLVANDKYWRGRGYLDSIRITAPRSIREQWMDLRVDQADIVEVPAELLRAAQQEHLRTVQSADVEVIVLLVSESSQQLKDERSRQAVAESIDRDALLSFIFQKQGQATAALVPNFVTGYARLFPVMQNLPHARELASQAKQQRPLIIAFESSDPALQLVAERVALNAHDAGLRLQAAAKQSVPQSDLEVRRVTLSSLDPSVALTALVRKTVGEDIPVETSMEGLFRREREIVFSYRVIPLLAVPRGFAAGSSLRNWSVSPIGVPDFAGFWVEERK